MNLGHFMLMISSDPAGLLFPSSFGSTATGQNRNCNKAEGSASVQK